MVYDAESILFRSVGCVSQSFQGRGAKLKYIVCLVADFGEKDMKSPTTVLHPGEREGERDEKGGYLFSLWT